MNKANKLIVVLSKFLQKHNITMSFSELSKFLNTLDILTKYGKKYQGKRGTATLISKTVIKLKKSNRHKEAETVSVSFVNLKGKLSWK